MANVIHSSEYPRSTFLILDNLLCLVAENSLDTILSHLRQFYPPRKQPRIEVKGKIYLVKQYAVKFGAISMGSVNKGIVVEVYTIIIVKSFQFHNFSKFENQLVHKCLLLMIIS